MNLLNKLSELKNKYLEESKRIVEKSFKDFFNDFPEVRKIVFAAYSTETNYYVMSDFYVFFKNHEEIHNEDEKYYDNGTNSYGLRKINKEMYERLKELESIDSYVAKYIFEENLVIAKETGFEFKQLNCDW